jgi:hypothetical protein
VPSRTIRLELMALASSAYDEGHKPRAAHVLRCQRKAHDGRCARTSADNGASGVSSSRLCFVADRKPFSLLPVVRMPRIATLFRQRRNRTVGRMLAYPPDGLFWSAQSAVSHRRSSKGVPGSESRYSVDEPPDGCYPHARGLCSDARGHRSAAYQEGGNGARGECAALRMWSRHPLRGEARWNI